MLDPIPEADLRQAILDSHPSLLGDLIGDEPNVVLTLARMLVTISTGELMSKDEAARRIGPDLAEPDRSVVSHAAADYLGGPKHDWSRCQRQVQKTADRLAASIRKTAADRKALPSH